MANEIKITARAEFTTADGTKLTFEPAIDKLFDADFDQVWHATQLASTTGRIVQVGGVGENPYLLIKNLSSTVTAYIYVTSTEMIQVKPGSCCLFRQANNVFCKTSSGTALLEVFAAGSEGVP